MFFQSSSGGLSELLGGAIDFLTDEFIADGRDGDMSLLCRLGEAALFDNSDEEVQSHQV